MSHFSVLVIGENIEAALQPFHEFECTGTSDRYVVDVDETDEYRKQYADRTESRLRAPDGELFSPYDNHFYRDPTDEEKKKIGPFTGSGVGNGLSWLSQDWGDGKGYRAKIRFAPEGYEPVEVPTREMMSFRDWVEVHTERKIVQPGEEPDVNATHKYGYIRVDAAGEVVQIIDRTNPNKKWDWWTIGGCYSGRLLLKSGAKADQASAGEVDWEGMLAEKARVAGETFDKIKATVGDREVLTWAQVHARAQAGELTWDAARDLYNGQQILNELYESGAIGRWGGAEDLSQVLSAPSREEYVDRYSKTMGTLWAMLYDGKWYERGEMGWFGMSDTTDESLADYATTFWATVRALPADTVVTCVDCHI